MSRQRKAIDVAWEFDAMDALGQLSLLGGVA